MKGKKVIVTYRETIEQFLARCALKCPQGMRIVSAGEHNEVVEVDVNTLNNKFKDMNVYNCFRNAIGVLYKKEYYALPETKLYVKMLQEFGIVKADFFVFLNEDQFPHQEHMVNRWKEIISNATNQRREEFKDDCRMWAKANKVQPVPIEELGHCLPIPINGIGVIIEGDEDDDGDSFDQYEFYDPIVKYVNPRSIEYVGSYSVYNNRVIFVDVDGTTYLAKGNHIVKILNNLNFRMLNYFLPFRDGEVIIDESLRKLWEQIPEINDKE